MCNLYTENNYLMKIIIIILSTTLLFSQDFYPADSLYQNKNTGAIKRLSILPIMFWQRISYNNDVFNCQFYPSCSNYCAKAFTKYGVLKGSIISLDRITRCNPAAYYYHLKLNRPYYERDGRMIDTIEQSSFAKSSKSPTLAATYSLLIPGFGRAYSNRKWDAVFGASTFLLISNSAYKNFQKDNFSRASILGVASILIYASEIYGSWRAAKYYQIKKKQSR